MKRKLMSILALAALVAVIRPTPVRAQVSVGGADDVPTLKPGDQWDFQRGFGLNLSIAVSVATLPVNLTFTDNARKIYTDVEVVNPNNAGFTFLDTVAYRRTRDSAHTAFTIGGGGSTSVIGTSVSFTLKNVTTVPTNGYDWLGVGDLCQIRENLATAQTITGDANITCSGLFCSTLAGQLPAGLVIGDNNFTADLDMNVDEGPQAATPSGGLEYLDFPASQANEKWTQVIHRAISGTINLNVSAGALVIDQDFSAGLDGSFAAAAPLTIVSTSKTSPAPGAFAGSTEVSGTFNFTGVAGPDDVYYNASAKDLVYWKLGNINNLINITGSTAVTGNLVNFITQIASAAAVSVDTSQAITNVMITPLDGGTQAHYGSCFSVSGTANAGDTVDASLLIPGGGGSTGSTVADGSGNFSINLTAPSQNDDSPMIAASPNYDDGSFGIALILNGAADPSKVVTVQLVNSPGTACPTGPTPTETATPVVTDTPTPAPTGTISDGRAVGDFDNSGCTDINDFLFLLDNWQLVSSIGGLAININDFLALLDNWQMGPSCPPTPSPTP